MILNVIFGIFLFCSIVFGAFFLPEILRKRNIKMPNIVWKVIGAMLILTIIFYVVVMFLAVWSGMMGMG